jgi:hypothetical protein
MVSQNLPIWLSPFIDKDIGDYQHRFSHNRSTTDTIFCICQILEKKWEHSGTVQFIFINLKIPVTQERNIA